MIAAGATPEGTCTLSPKFNVIRLCDPNDPDASLYATNFPRRKQQPPAAKPGVRAKGV